MKSSRNALAGAWIPLVIVMVVVLGGSMIARFHGVFGSGHQTGAVGKVDEIVSTIPKFLSYEVFGPSATSGMISYIDEHSQAQEARFAGLPWRHTVSTTAPSAFASLTVQGDSDSLGCRISVNGEVRDEVSVSGTDVMAFCLVKAA